MASDNPSSNLERAAQAAEEYENKHYQGGELDAQDFKKAGEQATAAVSNAATAVKEAVVGPSESKGPTGGAMPDAAAASDAAQRKAVANSPAEAHRSVLGQLMDKILPTAHAEGRSPGQKWEDAKDEARESGHQAKESARDAASAVGEEARRGYGRAEHETRRFLNRAGEATVGAAQEGVDVSRDAKERVKRDWPGREVRGVVEETKDLTNRAADRVKGDWERTKDGAQDMLDNSSAARQWREEHAPAPKKERGFFGSITHALFGAADDAEDKARDAADRTRANARSAADDVSNKAQESKENVRGFFNKAGDEAEHQANRAEDKTRGFFSRASEDTRDTADRAERKASSFWGGTKDEADRLGIKAEAKFNRWGDRINESVEDTENYVKDKWNQAEDYLEADLRPRTSGEAALQSGLIPSNTQDVLAARFGRRR